MLGPLRLSGDEGELAIGSRTQRVVLATLLARAGEVVSTASLIDAVWGDDAPPSAVNTLRSQVSRLRRLVGERLAAGPDGYALRLIHGTDRVDAWAFEAAVRRMRTDPGPTSRALLAAELASWRGDAFGELADVVTLRADARRLQLLRVDATELLARADLDAGQWSDAVAAVESIVAVDPVREPAWEILVRALAGAGRTADAMRAARRAAAALAESGLRPGSALRAAEAAALADPPSAAAVRSTPVVRRPLTPTVGRAGEVAEALRALEHNRLVTVVGPGGVGKTRVAGDVAAIRSDGHGRDPVMVELARVTDTAGVASTVASALDLRPTPGAELAALTDLGALDALVVLDNCEHVIDDVVELVPRLLSGGDRLHVLATSRESLAIDGEHVLALSPLSTDGPEAPAALLFRQRAAAAGPAGDLDDDLVADVVARLDGLPLALEMAAARLRTMSLADIVHSIGEDLDVLATTRRDVDERHRTLRGLLAWSERLLDDELREALHDFSVFAGPVRAVDLGAAVRTARPADTVARLVDRSLVQAEPTERGVTFGALETVRSFGRQRLREAGLDVAAGRRHATWFLDVVTDIDQRLRTVDAPVAIARFDDVIDEVRAAVRWAQRHDPDIAAELVVRSFAAGRVVLRSEVVSWVADVAGLLPVDHPAIDTVRGALADGLSTTGRLDEAVRIGDEVVARAGGSLAALPALEGLADAALYQGRLEEARALSGRLRVLGTELDDCYYADMGTVGLALATAYGGDVDGALTLVGEGPSCSSPSSAAWFEYTRGEAILDLDAVTALGHLDRALATARQAGDRYLTEVALVSSSSLRARTGELAGAVARSTELLDNFRRGGDQSHLVTSLRNLVTLLMRLRQYRPAAALYGAVRDHPSSPTYGAEAERLEEAAAECREALGEDEFGRVAGVGRDRTLDAAAEAASAALRNAGARLDRPAARHVPG